MPDLGDRIRSAAEVHDISLNEISRRSGVERSHLNRILSGETPNPGIETVGRIAEAAETTVAYLAGETDDPSRPPGDLPATGTDDPSGK